VIEFVYGKANKILELWYMDKPGLAREVSVLALLTE